MNKTLPTLLFLLVFSFALFPQSALMYEVSLEKQIQTSSAVIEGKVISKKSVWNHTKTLIYTINQVQVYKSFKGSTQEILEILTLGGTVGNDRLAVNPELKLNKV